MVANRFEIVSFGRVAQQTSTSFPNSDATLTIYDIDILSSGYRIEWRENYTTLGLFPQERLYSQNFNLNGGATSSVSTGVDGGSRTATSGGLTYIVFERGESATSQSFTVYAELAPSGFQGPPQVNVYTDPGGSSVLDGTSNDEIVELGAGNDTYYSSDGNVVSNGGEDTVFGGAGNDAIHLRNRGVTGEELYAGEANGDDGTDSLFLNGLREDYRVIAHGDTLLFRHQDFEDRSGLGRKIATGESIEFFQGVEIATIVEDGWDLRENVPNGSAPEDISAIRDYDGNDLGAGEDWRLIGAADVQYDNDAEWIYVNSTLGRWATVGPGDNGGVNFDNHGEGGDTRVVGIYIDPEVEAGRTERFSEFDSQQRFQEDLRSDTLDVVDAFDFDADGFQEIYFRETNGDAYLRALMHADGNIQYANYQVASQVEDYLSGLGYERDVIDAILG